MNKRFKYGRAFPINSDDSLPCITDSEKDKDYFRMSDIVNVLNEQQDTIKHLEEEMGELENDLLTARREKMDNYYPIPKNCDGCVFLKNNGICGYCTFTLKCYDSEDDLDEYGLLECCPFKHHQEYKTMIMNWDSLVEKASEISLRNIQLDELIGRLQRENEQLLQQLDYIQNSISYRIKHQKTELQVKALQEVIQDYNEWILGHKR